jgi:hypothetical protein
MEKKLENLHQHVLNLLECKLEAARELDNLLHEIVLLESDWSSEVNWSYLLSELKEKVGDVDLNSNFGFIEDIEEQINDVPYKIKRASNSFKLAVNPIFKNTPVFFDAAYPPDPSDYFEQQSISEKE